MKAEKPSWEYPTVSIPGWHAQAVAIALREFQGKPEKGEPAYGDIRHYTVNIISREREVEILFAPKSGPKDWKNRTLGGRTQYGVEVSYHISKDLKIIRTTFAR